MHWIGETTGAHREHILLEYKAQLHPYVLWLQDNELWRDLLLQSLQSSGKQATWISASLYRLTLLQ